MKTLTTQQQPTINPIVDVDHELLMEQRHCFDENFDKAYDEQFRQMDIEDFIIDIDSLPY
jgi:hypothetical protein